MYQMPCKTHLPLNQQFHLQELILQMDTHLGITRVQGYLCQLFVGAKDWKQLHGLSRQAQLHTRVAQPWNGALFSHAKERAGSLVHKVSEFYYMQVAEPWVVWSCFEKSKHSISTCTCDCYTSQLDLGQLGDRSVHGMAGAEMGSRGGDWRSDSESLLKGRSWDGLRVQVGGGERDQVTWRTLA